MGFSVREWGDPVRQSEEFGLVLRERCERLAQRR